MADKRVTRKIKKAEEEQEEMEVAVSGTEVEMEEGQQEVGLQGDQVRVQELQTTGKEEQRVKDGDMKQLMEMMVKMQENLQRSIEKTAEKIEEKEEESKKDKEELKRDLQKDAEEREGRLQVAIKNTAERLQDQKAKAEKMEESIKELKEEFTRVQLENKQELQMQINNISLTLESYKEEVKNEVRMERHGENQQLEENVTQIMEDKLGKNKEGFERKLEGIEDRIHTQNEEVSRKVDLIEEKVDKNRVEMQGEMINNARKVNVITEHNSSKLKEVEERLKRIQDGTGMFNGNSRGSYMGIQADMLPIFEGKLGEQPMTYLVKLDDIMKTIYD